MAPLKSLEKKYPIIDFDFRQFCASNGIFSVEDLLVSDLYVLAALAEQHSASKRLKQGIAQVLSIIDSLHQPWVNGMELLEDAQNNKHFLSTGCESIDNLLQGGLREGYLTELVGPSSSGKTQVNQKSLETVLKGIICYSVFDIFMLLDVLHQLNSNFSSETGGQVQLLVVDSISSLLTPVLGGRGSHGRALMVSTGSLLKKMAHEHNIAVLVTNHMVSGEGGNSKPALGESWKSVPHVRIQLSREHGSNILTCTYLDTHIWLLVSR
ncbi:ATP diphosphatase [Bertholletia excelsa]